MHHGSGDAQRRVAFILHTVHVLDRVTSESVDKDTGGVGFGHALHLEGRRGSSVDEFVEESRYCRCVSKQKQ